MLESVESVCEILAEFSFVFGMALLGDLLFDWGGFLFAVWEFLGMVFIHFFFFFFLCLKIKN